MKEKKEYIVTITKTLFQQLEIMAETEAEAIRFAREKLWKGEIDFDANQDCVNTEVIIEK